MERTECDTEQEYIRDCIDTEETSGWAESSIEKVVDLVLNAEAHAKEHDHYRKSSYPTSGELADRSMTVDSAREMGSAVRLLGRLCLDEEDDPYDEWRRYGRSARYDTTAILQSAAEGIEAYEPPEGIDF